MLFLTSSNNFVTSHFVQFLPQKPQDLRVTFIPTAAEVEHGDLQWLKDDRQALVDAGFPVQDFTVTGKTPKEVQEMLQETDFVFVSGGNTFYLLQEMRRSGFADLIQGFVKRGGIYGGTSAGSIVAGPDISLSAALDNTDLAPDLNDYTGLNLIDVVILPHWGSSYFGKKYQSGFKIISQNSLKSIPLTDSQYLRTTPHGYIIENTDGV